VVNGEPKASQRKPKAKQQKDNIKLTLVCRNIMTFAVRKK